MNTKNYKAKNQYLPMFIASFKKQEICTKQEIYVFKLQNKKLYGYSASEIKSRVLEGKLPLFGS